MEENVDTDSCGARYEAPVALPDNGEDMTESREGWTEMLREAHAEELRDVIAAWGEAHGDFRTFVTQRLRPSINDVDFRLQLVRAINRESREVQTRYTSDVIVDWGKVYYDYIEPWAEQVDAMTTAQLCRLAEALLTVVCGRITEEDFFGDDWYGTDFSNELQEIADTVGGLVSFLVVRTDVGEIMLDTLEQIIRKLPNKRVLLEYLDSPFEEVEALLEIRRQDGDVTRSLYDKVIECGFRPGKGAWTCRLIDFLRAMGNELEASEMLETCIGYPEVALKRYNELIEAGQWREAIGVLDRASALLQESRYGFDYRHPMPDWLGMKQELLARHGTVKEQIDNLVLQFHSGHGDQMKHYLALKGLVPSEEWRDFYHHLLSGIKHGSARTLAPFLIEEEEYDWLYELIVKDISEVSSDYRTPLEFAKVLHDTHFAGMSSILRETFLAYAADRYAQGRTVNPHKYTYFRQALETLGDYGYAALQAELVAILLERYRQRRSLVRELRAIRL